MTTSYMDDAEENRGRYTKQGPESLLHSERRRMKLQSDLVKFQRDQRLSRAVRLQSQWQELSERECRAQQQNRQLLQEFDRAQDTLRDMVTRTAAMNTIRVEYERYLEESFPRWQQQLKQKTLSTQRKRMEQHLKECLRSMEEDRGEERGSRTPFGTHPPFSPCHVQQLQNAAVHQEHHNQNGHQDYVPNGHHHPSIPSIQSSWLIHAHSQLANSQTRMHSKLQQRDMTHIPAHPLHSHGPHSLYPPQHYPVQSPQSYSAPIKPHIVIQQETPPTGYPMQWAAGVATAGLPFRAPVGLQTSWTSPAMPDTQGWRMVQGVAGEDEGRESSAVTSPEGGSSVGHRHRREKISDLAHELDIKPVRLSSGHGESSESSRTSSQASKESVSSRERRKRKEKKGGRGGQSSTDRSSAGSGEVVIAEASVSTASVVQSSENDGTSVVGSNRSRRSRGLANPFSAEESGSHREESGSNREGSVSQMEESNQFHESGSHRAKAVSHMDKSLSHRTEAMSQMEESRSKMQESIIKMESVSHRDEVASEKEVGEKDMEATEGEEESLVGLSVEEGATVEEEEGMGEHDGEEGRETEEEEGEHDGEKVEGKDQEEGNEASQRDREEGEEEEEVQPESESVSIREHTAEEEEERGEEEAEEAQDSEGQEEVEWSDRGVEEESENEREDSHTSQDGEIEEVVKDSREEEEDVGVGGERDGGEEEEEEHRCQDAEEDSAAGQREDEEESDSDDSIISPPEHRSSKGLAEVAEEEEEEVIGENDEDEGEDDEDAKVKGYSWSVDPFPDEDDDIESLLAPQAKSQEKKEKEEKEKTAVLVKPKAIDEDLDSFSEVKAPHKKKGANQDTDSEEFDHFYD